MENSISREQMLAAKYPKKEKYKYLGTIGVYRFIALGVINGSFSLLLAMIVADLGFDPMQRAALITANTVGQLIASFIVGFLVDRVNSKMMCVLTMFVAGISCLLRCVGIDFSFWLVIMAIWGFCYNAMIVNNLKILGLWFKREETHRFNGIFVLCGPVGQLFALQFGLSLCELLGGWTKFYLLGGVIILVMGVIVLITCKNRPNEDSEVPANYKKEETGFIKDLLAVAKIPRMWALWIAELASSSMISIVSAYALLVLQNDPGWGLEIGIARRATQMTMLGAVVGYFIVPNLAAAFRKRFKRQETGIVIFTIICGVIMVSTFVPGYTSYNFTLLRILCFIGGIAQGGYVSGPKAVMVMLPEVAGGRAGTATSCASIIGRIGLVCMSAVIGALAAQTHDNAIIMAAIYSIIAVGVVALIVYLILDQIRVKKLNNATINS